MPIDNFGKHYRDKREPMLAIVRPTLVLIALVANWSVSEIEFSLGQY